uniref:Uncharacterized protein n=1 Tax=Arundo donax TaxID=35708 RepID=A0A0A9C4Z7_ARUDO
MSLADGTGDRRKSLVATQTKPTSSALPVSIRASSREAARSTSATRGGALHSIGAAATLAARRQAWPADDGRRTNLDWWVADEARWRVGRRSGEVSASLQGLTGGELGGGGGAMLWRARCGSSNCASATATAARGGA